MSSKTPVVITTRQAKKQINHFGRSLLIYVLLSVAVKYALIYTERYFPNILRGVDADLAHLYASIILLLFVTLVPFSISETNSNASSPFNTGVASIGFAIFS